MRAAPCTLHALLCGIFYFYGIGQVNYCLIKHALGANGFVCVLRCCVRAQCVCRPYMKTPVRAQAFYLSRFKNLLQSSDFRDYLHSRAARPFQGGVRLTILCLVWFTAPENKLKKQLWLRRMQIKWNICCFFTYFKEGTAWRKAWGFLIIWFENKVYMMEFK